MAWSGKSATCSCLPKCFSFLLWSKSTCRIADTYKKWFFFSVFSVNPFFGRCGLFPQDFEQVQGHIILYLIKIKRVCFIVLCRILLVFFGIEGDREECKNLRKMVNSKYFCRLGPFPQVFEQVEEWLMLELHEMIRFPYVAACSVVFSLLCNIGRPVGVLRLIKNAHFLIFLAVWVLFLSFWAG